MEETREQPTMEPASALNPADKNSVESEVGSQGEFGKFKNADALLEAYNNLQAEFTRKCQLLSNLQKDKMQEEKFSERENDTSNFNNINELEGVNKNEVLDESNNSKISEKNFEESLQAFLDANADAKEFANEIKNEFSNAKTSPFEDAWAKVVFSQLKEGKLSDNMINQYLISDENIKNKVIESYLKNLQNNKPPLIISSSGERLSQVKPDSPKTLAEAKQIVDKMFS